MRLSPARAKEFEKKALSDTIFFARNVLGFNWANVDYNDSEGRPKGKRVGPVTKDSVIKEGEPNDGDGWGISYEVEAHRAVAEALDTGETRLLFLLPRGSLKSTYLTADALRTVIEDRNRKVLYCMDTAKKATLKLTEVKRILEENKTIRALWGDLRTKQWARDSFTVAGRTIQGDPNPSFCVGSPETSITGLHFTDIYLDDLENWDTVKTPEQLKKAKEFLQQIIPILDPGGRLIVCGTRYADEDLYGWIMKEFPEFKVVTFDCGMVLERDDAGREQLIGEPRFKHLSKLFLDRALGVMGVQKFSSQYLNVCMSGTRQAFHRHHFKTEKWDRWMEELSVYMITDTATSTDDDACHSVVGLIGVDRSDTAYLLDIWFGRVLPADYVRYLCDMLEKWDQRVRIRKILMEQTTANQVYRPLIESEWRQRQMRKYPWEPINRGGVAALAKDRRIERLHPRFEDGRFVVVDTVPKHIGEDMVFVPDAYLDENTGHRWPDGELVRQFIRWPATKSKDIPDAIADIDHIDGKGERLCTGMGIRAAKRARSLAGRKGQRIDRSRLPGRRRRGDFGGDPWGERARRLGG